ncbi:MAG: short-chain dehydrogenase [Rhodobacteraceae bacterium]|nr:short-chain dehydrogenase [Paracoccaceae bacterium]
MKRKSILLTGCSSGIGYDAAHGLKSRGWEVFATCRRESDVNKLRSEGFYSFVLDYTNEASMDEAIQSVLNVTQGRLNALFNNGAFACPGAVEDLPTDALRSVFETNFFGYHYLTKKIIAVMRQQGYGRIINCSSVLGMVAMPWRGSYVASKFALEGLTHTLRIEMKDTPIRVILIQPGPIKSKIRENSLRHFEKWIDWKSSPRAAQYQNRLLVRLYENKNRDYFELPPSAVTRKLIKALEATNPNPCYFVTIPTYTMNFLRRLLPTRWLDYLIEKSL